MSNPSIRIHKLSKQYRIGITAQRHDTIRDLVAHAVGSPIRSMKRLVAALRSEESTYFTDQNSIWALRDASLEVQPGEVIGIIGRNGAGKSTLLKILSRITEPTSGHIELRGRVAALLEVGTGFHPELTGRENVYLNGAILGMSRREIASKFDEIVAFAELSKFIDTPVKRYSSGMYVRLAFAVAAHLEPEVLVVDEVLAVGDGAFQAKCIGKMNDVALTQGRTVVFVSHNLAAVRQLCTRAVMLHEGAVAIHGPTDQVLGVYADQLRGPCIVSGAALEDRLKRASGAVRFTSVTCVAADGKETWIFDEQDEITVFLRYEVISDVDSLGLYLALQSSLSSEVVTSLKEPICHSRVASTHQGTIRVKLFGGCLRTGDYSLYICLGTRDCDRLFDIIDHNVGLPYLRLQSKKRDPHLTEGYFTIPYSISADPDSIANTASFSPSLK